MSDSKVLTVMTSEAARNRAREQVKKYQEDGAMICIRPEDLATHGMFYPVPVAIPANESDFHQIKGGKLMPKGHHTEKIARATGTSIFDVSSRKERDYIWVGSAKGRRRMPDGTYEQKGADYEFDAEMRAEEDILGDADKYPTDVSKRQHLLALCRFGRQRAETGASLRVIRKLANIPTAFSRGEINRSMIFVRIEVNTDQLLTNPSTARMAVQLAIGDGGAVQQIYGPQARDDRPQEAIPAPEGETIEGDAETIDATEIDPEFEDPPFGGDEPETPEETYIRRLHTYRKDWDLPESANALIDGILELKEPTLVSLKDLNKRIGDYLTRKGREPMTPEGVAS